MSHSIAIAYLKQADPVLGQLIERIGESAFFELPVQPDLFSALTRAIIYQQISTTAATTINQRVIQYYQAQQTPFTAKELLNTPEEALRKLGLSSRKVMYIQSLAQAIENNFPSLQELAIMEDEVIIQTLISLKGVGRWTAQMLLIFDLQRPDVLPVNDLGIRTAIAKWYSLETLPNPQVLEQIAQSWRPYRSLACRYLWRSLSR